VRKQQKVVKALLVLTRTAAESLRSAAPTWALQRSRTAQFSGSLTPKGARKNKAPTFVRKQQQWNWSAQADDFLLSAGAIEREKCEKMRALRVRVRWGKGQSAGLPTCIGNCLCTAARSQDKSITERSRSIFCYISEEAFYVCEGIYFNAKRELICCVSNYLKMHKFDSIEILHRNAL
jgi:hypothetical protein